VDIFAADRTRVWIFLFQNTSLAELERMKPLSLSMIQEKNEHLVIEMFVPGADLG
jgi:hypothetical protein